MNRWHLGVYLIITMNSDLMMSQSKLNIPENGICREDSEPWRCLRFSRCPTASKELRQKRKPIICSFLDNEPVVCCRPSRESEDEVQPQWPSSNDNRLQQTSSGIAKKKCQEYSEAVYKRDGHKKLNTCSISEPPYLFTFVVDGTDAAPMEFPHMVQLGYGNVKKLASFNCGGSLISESWIMTAAHCSQTDIGPPRWAKLGELDQNSETDDATPLTLRIVQIKDHPQYIARTKKNDISLMKLECSLLLTPYIRPACLPNGLLTELEAKKNVIMASGWGATEFAGASAGILQKVHLSIVDGDSCNKIYSNRVQNDVMICAKGTEKRGDTCQGDSGGPLEMVLESPYCMYSIIGITSFGLKCGIAPGVYTRVSAYINWIENTVWSNASIPSQSCNNS